MNKENGLRNIKENTKTKSEKYSTTLCI